MCCVLCWAVSLVGRYILGFNSVIIYLENPLQLFRKFKFQIPYNGTIVSGRYGMIRYGTYCVRFIEH